MFLKWINILLIKNTIFNPVKFSFILVPICHNRRMVNYIIRIAGGDRGRYRIARIYDCVWRINGHVRWSDRLSRTNINTSLPVTSIRRWNSFVRPHIRWLSIICLNSHLDCSDCMFTTWFSVFFFCFVYDCRTNASREDNRDALIADSKAFGLSVILCSIIQLLACAISVDLVNYSALKQVGGAVSIGASFWAWESFRCLIYLFGRFFFLL